MRQERLLRPREVAEQLGVSRATVYRMIDDGRIPAVRIGEQPRSPVRIDPEELASRLVPLESDDLLSLDVVAARIGRPLDWCLARLRLLPFLDTASGPKVRRDDLAEWHRAAARAETRETA